MLILAELFGAPILMLPFVDVMLPLLTTLPLPELILMSPAAVITGTVPARMKSGEATDWEVCGWMPIGVGGSITTPERVSMTLPVVVDRLRSPALVIVPPLLDMLSSAVRLTLPL